MKLKIKITWPYLIKGVIYAAILLLGTGIGVIMREEGAQGFTIWAVVGVLNTLAVIYVFWSLKQDIEKGKEAKEPNKAETAKDKKSKNKDDDKKVEKNKEGKSDQTEAEDGENLTESDKKVSK